MKLPSNMIKKLNKLASRISKYTNIIKERLKCRILLAVAFLLSVLRKNENAFIETLDLPANSSGDIVLNCTGYTGVDNHAYDYARDIDAVSGVLKQAALSLTAVVCAAASGENNRELAEKMREYRMVDVLEQDSFIQARLLRAEAGNVAVISCRPHCAGDAKGRSIRLALAQSVLAARKAGAEYILVYIVNNGKSGLDNAHRELCGTLLRIGVDYVVGVTPGTLDGGTMYMQPGRSFARAVYSLGTFLTSSQTLPGERAIIRLKLRRVNGKLQAYEESYYPLLFSAGRGLTPLIDEEGERELTTEELQSLGFIERKLSRLHRADRILTIGKLVQAIGGTLPEKYAWLKDFSIGKFHANPAIHQPGDVYFWWERFSDANDADTYKATVRNSIINGKRIARNAMFIVSYTPLSVKAPYIIVDNALEAHIAACAYVRRQLPVRTIAVTGSIGKTTTKDMLAEVMKVQYNTAKSLKNGNTHTRISASVQGITSDCEVYIQEVGGGHPGGASRHSRMVLPEATIVTNIGDAHIGNYGGSRELLMENKLGITEGMPENGVVFLNGDDPLLSKAQPACRKVLYAVHNTQADYYAENIVEDAESTTFQIIHNGQKVADVLLKVPGKHNVLNAVCCFAVGRQFGIPGKAIVRGLANFRTTGIRQNLVRASGVTLFLDCFNASSASIESSLKTLSLLQCPAQNKRVALIGDITGLGELAEQTHKDIAATLIANPPDLFVFHGANVKYTYEAVKAHGLNAVYLPDKAGAIRYLSEHMKPGDVLLAKGSSKMQLEYVIDCVFGTRTYDQVLLEDYNLYKTTAEGVSYNLFPTHATAVKALRTARTSITVKKTVGGVSVVNICSGFGFPALESVTLHNGIRHIDPGAFRNNKKLKTVTGTKGLKFIGDAAFSGCAELRELELSEGLLHIGDNAFSDCRSLRELYIPSSVVQIGRDAFLGCPKLKLMCESGSCADEILSERGLPHRVRGEDGTWTVIGGKARQRKDAPVSELIWDLDPDGVLTVSGSVQVMDSVRAPWFGQCLDVKSIVISGDVTSIGNRAFTGCKNCTSISIPASVTSIGKRAFWGCDGLTEINIPKGVKWIGQRAFSGCGNLFDIRVHSDNRDFSSADGVLLSAGTRLICYPRAKSGSYMIPERVAALEAYSFADCDCLTQLTAHSGVTAIGENAFSGCERLAQITLCNAYCVIGDSRDTLGVPGYTMVCGYDGSTAEKYASKWGYTFQSLGEAPPRNGWLVEDGRRYYYENDVKQTGWLSVNRQRYYLAADGHMMKNGPLTVNGRIYYLAADGHMMKNSSVTYKGKTYYLAADGHVIKTEPVT